jgi:hypothetical protein
LTACRRVTPYGQARGARTSIGSFGTPVSPEHSDELLRTYELLRRTRLTAFRGWRQLDKAGWAPTGQSTIAHLFGSHAKAVPKKPAGTIALRVSLVVVFGMVVAPLFRAPSPFVRRSSTSPGRIAPHAPNGRDRGQRMRHSRRRSREQPAEPWPVAPHRSCRDDPGHLLGDRVHVGFVKLRLASLRMKAQPDKMAARGASCMCVRRRERISRTFRPNRLLTRAARYAHLTEPRPQGSDCVLRNILVSLFLRGALVSSPFHKDPKTIHMV